jgi:hypothetical protein
MQQRRIVICYWAVIAVFVILVGMHFHPEFGFTSLIRFGEKYENKRSDALNDLPHYVIQKNGGYDGQFYAEMVLDPLLKNPELKNTIDYPSYRARRILLPFIAWAFGMGNPLWSLQIFSLINVVCWFALAALLLHWMPPTSWYNFAKWTACLFSVGVVESLRQSLTDLPSLVFVIISIRLLEQQKIKSALGILAIGTLARELTILGMVNVWNEKKFSKEAVARFCFYLGIVILPFILWLIYVSTKLGFSARVEHHFDIPFVAMIDGLRVAIGSIGQGVIDKRYFPLPLIVLSIFIRSMVIISCKEINNPWWRIGIVYIVMFFTFGDAMWQAWWGLSRVLLPLTIAFNVLLKPDKNFWVLFAVGNFPTFGGLERFVWFPQ